MKTQSNSVDLVNRVIRLAQGEKGKLKGMECFCHFLEAVESGKLDALKHKSEDAKGTTEEKQ